MAAINTTLFCFYLFVFVSGSPTKGTNSVNKGIIKGNTGLAISILRSIASENKRENYAVSPWSISLGFAMLTAGARGKSLAELLKVFQWKNEKSELHDSISEISRHLTDRNNGTSLKIAAKLWLDEKCKTKKEFEDVLRAQYHAKLGRVTFARNTLVAIQTINNWIASQTGDKIKNMFSKESLDSNTKFVLTNAVFFKGKWKTRFLKKDTQKTAFKTHHGTKMVDMMRATGNFALVADKKLGCRALEIPYSDDSISMTIVLPNKKDGLSNVINQLTVSRLKELTTISARPEVEVFLPKFHINTKHQLVQTLSKLGIKSLFTTNADLSGITGEKNLYVSKAVHQADIEVNEEGTTASAGTGIAGSAMSMPVQFIVDHPFLFLIREKETGSIIFAGIVTNPLKA